MGRIERGQFADFLRRYLSMAGQMEVGQELSPEVSPVFVIESERPEWEFLKGNRIMAHSANVSGAVGAAAARWRNPPGSGMVAVFYSMRASSPNPAVAPPFTIVFATVGPQLADQATIAGTTPRDGRQTPVGGAIIASNGIAALGGNGLDSSVIQNMSVRFLENYAVVVPPGFAINIGFGAIGPDGLFTAQWIEKRLDELERQ